MSKDKFTNRDLLPIEYVNAEKISFSEFIDKFAEIESQYRNYNVSSSCTYIFLFSKIKLIKSI